MIVDCISDLHGHYPELEGGDILIVSGDLTTSDKPIQYGNFGSWIQRKNYKKKIIISGNHDNYLDNKRYDFIKDIYEEIKVDYLCDSGTEFGGIKIWGSPYTMKFDGMNPNCMAFTCDTDDELNEHWKLIPDEIDILITHCPPHGILDKVIRADEHNGSKTLREHVIVRIKPRLHVFGHIHEWGGKIVDCCTTRFVNCSHMNEEYEPVNKPIRVIL